MTERWYRLKSVSTPVDPKAICFLDFPAENNGAHKIVQQEASFQVPLISFCFCREFLLQNSVSRWQKKSTFSYFKTFAQIIEKTPPLPSYVPNCHHIRKNCHQHTNWTMSYKDLLSPAKVISYSVQYSPRATPAPLLTWICLNSSTHFIKFRWPLGDPLVTAWGLLGDHLVIARWPLGDHLLTTWGLLGDHLRTT